VDLLLVIPSLFSKTAFEAVTSIATIGLYISYVIPIALRISFAQDRFVPGPFTLGKYGYWMGLVSCLYVAFITVLFTLPPVYPVTLQSFNYASFAVLFTFGLSSAWWIASARHWFRVRLPVVPGEKEIEI
jgi:hypothetical protein